ncbi:MAG: 50S ribosome-binding GTPase, partial [Planctomycetota bacterium]|nr:50S ribosome-binding GTPase [Planctomycetota bacterium]
MCCERKRRRIRDVADVPLVVIVGRPNVGKSTLFNRLLGRNFSIVERVSGVTRDVVTALVESSPDRSRKKEKNSFPRWVYELADTGGMLDKVEWEEGVLRCSQELLRQAIEEAFLVVFVVDAADGLVPADKYVADVLRKSGKRVLLVANKADNREREASAGEFCALGFGEPLAVSALHGVGLGELRERIASYLPKTEGEKLPDVRIAIVGKRNAGKSTLVNRLCGAERVIVDDLPGTTRDAVEVVVERKGKRFIVIDTAGMRQKRAVKDSVE